MRHSSDLKAAFRKFSAIKSSRRGGGGRGGFAFAFGRVFLAFDAADTAFAFFNLVALDSHKIRFDSLLCDTDSVA